MVIFFTLHTTAYPKKIIKMYLKPRIQNLLNYIMLKKTYYLSLVLFLAYAMVSPLTVLANDWIYTTRPGDTIWDISKKYLKSVNYWPKVKKHNEVNIAKHLSPGTRIRIPLKWLKIQPAPANVVSVTGTVHFKTPDSDNLKSLTNENKINIGDVITTGNNGNTLILFADGSTLLIQKNSRVEFYTLSSYGQTGMVDTRLRLQQGRIETTVNPMRDTGSRYEVTTPAAVAAVRGTRFRVAYENNKQAMASEVVKGAINIAAVGVNQLVDPGFGTITEKGKPPQPPVKLLQQPVLNTLPDKLRHSPFTFSWTPLDGAKKYRIQILTDSEPQTLSFEDTGESTEFTFSNILDGYYILRIRGIDKNGLEGFNAEHKFSIDTNFPTPSLTSPISNIELTEAPYLFQWGSNKNINQYHLQIATDSHFNNIVIDRLESNNSLTLEDKLSPGNYFWRVAAVDEQANKGQYTDVERFTITESSYESLLILLYLLPAFIL